MKINGINAQDCIKRTTISKQKMKKGCDDVVNLIEHVKNTSLGNDPKNLAEILVMINSVGLNRVLEYFK